ncbi:hypothetical protein ACIA03_20200 [Nocardioides sp. NPDC051685]
MAELAKSMKIQHSMDELASSTNVEHSMADPAEVKKEAYCG